jgi:thiamine-monophosphate kinase
VVGSAPAGKAVTRSKARPGDYIYVSGELGAAGATVADLRKKGKEKLSPRLYPKHFYPEPRIELGRTLREQALAAAMIDTSDGLSTDLAHICEESGVGAELYEEAIPRARVGKPPRPVDLRFALHGGEDYELLFTARPTRCVPSRIAGVQVTRIGEIPFGPITRGKRIVLINRRGGRVPLKVQGWEHFRK